MVRIQLQHPKADSVVEQLSPVGLYTLDIEHTKIRTCVLVEY